MSYRVILFDADGTLLDYERAQAHALQRAFAVFGLAYDPQSHLKQYRQISQAMWREYEEGRISADALRVERFRRLLEQGGITLSPEAFSDRYLGELSQTSFVADGALELLARLHGRYLLGVVTNGLSSVQHARVEHSGLAQYLGCVVVSEEVGFAKPDPRIFVCALKRIRHRDRSSVLVVGDSLDADVGGAVAFGVDACWLNLEGRQNTHGPFPAYQIRRLGQLEEVLASPDGSAG